MYKKDHGQSFAVAMKMLQPVYPGSEATGSQLQQYDMEMRLVSLNGKTCTFEFERMRTDGPIDCADV